MALKLLTSFLLCVITLAGSMPALADPPLVGVAELIDDAIIELSDPPSRGLRTTADLLKRWGSDVFVIDSATDKLQQALSKAQFGHANQDVIRHLQMAVDYGRTRQHKEARLSAQGALYYLCQQGAPGC